jgi:Arylsulfotransferase (ASST)
MRRYSRSGDLQVATSGSLKAAATSCQANFKELMCCDYCYFLSLRSLRLCGSKSSMKLSGIISIFFFIPMGLMPMVIAGAGNPPEVANDNQSLSVIKSLPYLQGYRPAPEKTGVIRYDRQTAYPGLNFYVGGSMPGAVLMKMDGEPIHKWLINPGDLNLPEESHCRRAHIFPDGKLLGIFEGDGKLSGPLIKLDRDSRILWEYRSNCHHDLFVTERGLIYVLTHRKRDEYPGQELSGPILEDYITILSPEGKEIKSVSLIKCFVNSPYFYVMSFAQTQGDIFHTNTLEVLDGKMEGKIPIFKKGRVLISIRNLSLIALVDLEDEKVCWLLWGMWNVQHQPTVLENGNLLLFDNSQRTGDSKIIEFNPLTQEILWSYQGDSKNHFYSGIIGSNQRLPNGNTLITESETGRAFEITRDGRIVWEFINPDRAGPEDNLSATLYELIRLKPDYLTVPEWNPYKKP